MTQILHVSDTHLDKRQYGQDLRRTDFADAFDASVDIAIEEGVDAVIHTGDLFDDPTPSVPAVNRCLDTIGRLEDAGIPFLAIVGNHERKREEQWMDIIKRFGNAKRLSKSPTVVTDANGNDPVSVYGIDAIRSPEWDGYDFTLDEPESNDHVTILCMHELVQPLVPEHRGDPYDLSEDVLDRLNFLPTALALGDYHSTCNDTVDGVKVFYPGATERCKVSERGTPSVYLLTAKDGELSRKTRAISTAGRENVPRPFLPVNIDFDETHGLDHAATRIDEDAGGMNDDISDMVVVARLTGANVGVTAKDVYDLTAEREVAVSYVDDKRQPDVDFDFDFDDEQTESQNPDNMLDDAVGGLEISTITTEADDLVRDDTVDDDDIRPEMNARIRTEQKEQFGEATLEER